MYQSLTIVCLTVLAAALLVSSWPTAEELAKRHHHRTKATPPPSQKPSQVPSASPSQPPPRSQSQHPHTQPSPSQRPRTNPSPSQRPRTNPSPSQRPSGTPSQPPPASTPGFTCDNACADSQDFCQYINVSAACNNTYMEGACAQTCCNLGVLTPEDCKVPPAIKECKKDCTDQATWCTYITTPDACNNTYMEGQCAQTCCTLGVVQPQDCSKVPPVTQTCKTDCSDKGDWCTYITTPSACNNTYMEGECAQTCCTLGVVLPQNCKK